MASKKITELTSGSITPPLSGSTIVTYSGQTYQQTLSTLRDVLVDSGSHNFTGNQSFDGNINISGSIYLPNDQTGVFFGPSGSIQSTMGYTNISDETGYVQIDVKTYNEDDYVSLTINSQNDESIFNVSDNSLNRLGARIELSSSGSFNISTDDNTAELLINGISYDSHLLSTSSFNNFTSSIATTGSNIFIGNETISGSLNISGSATLNNDNIVSSNTIEKIETITSASYASLNPPISGTLYIIID